MQMSRTKAVCTNLLMNYFIFYGLVLELEDRTDLKSVGVKHRVGASPTLVTKSECSAVWSACLIWIQEVVGSNPTTPTIMPQWRNW